MADKYSYFTPEQMQDKKMSDLTNNEDFLTDAVTFLQSKRKGYTAEDFQDMSADDVVSEVLEHFRYQTTNEVTVAKDIYFMNDEDTPVKQRESFGRLMFAFDNAKGEGLFDRGAEKIGDYFMGTASAPSTYVSAIAGAGTAGTGAAAIQATKQASLAALRTAGKKAIKRSLVAGMADGAVGAGFEYGNQKLRESAADDIDIDYEVDKGAVALSGALGFAVGAGTYGAGAAMQHRGARKLADTIDEGRVAKAEAVKEADALATRRAKEASKDPKKKAKLEAATNKVLQAIDPKLVEEGDNVKKYLLSKDMPEGVVGGLSQETIRRLSAASYDLAERLKVDISDPNIRITEVLANNIGDNKRIFDSVADEFGLSARELSAAYASEVSTAAKVMAGQSAISRAGKRKNLKDLADKVDQLYEAGMATARAEDLSAIESATRGTQNIIWRKFKDVENARRMFMTSQPATTMRNNIFSVAMTGIDIVDQLNASVLRTVTKGRKEGMATAKGALDNLKYLTKDAYVADSLITMLHTQAPKSMQRVFFDAAVAESHLVKDSVLSKAGAAVNTLNTMSDAVVKRAVITGNIDRQLKLRGDEAIGTSVIDMLRKGTVSKLPDDILESALDESLAFTFQRRLGGKGASEMNQAAADVVKFIHKYGITTVIPFPRFLASQAKFVSDYTGLTILRHGIKDSTTEEYSKMMTGAMAFGGLFAIQKENIAKGLEWFETEGPDGKPYDAQAALGPLSAQTYAANYIARIAEGKPTKDTATVIKDLSKIMGSTEFRPGTGLADNLIKALEAGDTEPLLNQLGDYFGSYTYPAAVVKDFYGQLDPSSSRLAETRDGTVSMVELMGYDVPMSTIQRVTRHLPDFDSAAISAQLEDSTGISIAPEKLAKTLEFFNTSTRTYYQTQYTKNADGTNMRQDAIRFDIFGDGPIKVENPLVKQITGLLGRPPKNELQREMSRLQIDPFQLYNPYREQNVTLELFTQQKLQGNLAAKAAIYMQTPEYQNATDEERKVLLTASKGFIPTMIGVYRKDAKRDLEKMASMPEAQGDYIAYIASEFNSVGGKSKQLADALWGRSASKYGYEGMDINQALASVKANKDLTDTEKEAYMTNIKKIYLDLSR